MAFSFSLTKIAKGNRIYQKQNNEECKKTWLKVFHHKAKSGYFNSLDEAKACSEEGKYSILSSMSDSMKISGSFEFRLEYPLEGLVYHWKQTANPLLVNEGSMNPENFIQLLVPNNNFSWRGYLAKSNYSRCTLLDGTSGNIWWFSIGTIECPYDLSDFFSKHPGKIPGPSNIAVDEVVLWIRVPNEALITIHKQICAIIFLTTL